ncbi:MAG: ABC transporter permease [Conexivisphaerales archaeon]
MNILSKIYAYIYLRGFRVWYSYKTQAVLTLVSWVLPVFTYYFTGTALGDSLVSNLGAGNYTAYLVIGLAFQGYVASTITTASQRLRNEQLYGTIEYYVLAPSGALSFLIYTMMWGLVMNSISAIVILLVGIALGVTYTLSGTLIALVLISLLMFSSFGLAALSGAVVMVTKQGNPISVFYSTVSTLLGNVVFPVAVLPYYLRLVSYSLPLTWALQGLREALLYGQGFSTIFPDILIMLLFVAVLVPLGTYAYIAAFNKARKDGTLSQY